MEAGDFNPKGSEELRSILLGGSLVV